MATNKKLFKNKNSHLSITPFTVLLFLTVFVIGLALGRHFETVKLKANQVAKKFAKDSLENYDFTLYWQVYSQLKSKYVDPQKLNAKKMYYGSIKGMVAALGDPATMFLDPDETKDFQRSLGAEYEGVGILLDLVQNIPHVVTAFEGAPAYKAGIRSGDFIVAVDGKDVSGMVLGKVASLIRGKAGTKVKLTIVRHGKRQVIEVTRGKISAPSMRFVERKDNIDIIRVSRFTEPTLGAWIDKWDSLLTKVLVDIKAGKTKGLIVDLRDNPGGYFDAAVYMLGDFISMGKPVAYQADRSGIVRVYKTTRTPKFPGSAPIVLLVNGGTASAAEIFSGAMQFYKRAYVIGEKTYGKGTVQTVLNFDKFDGSSLHVTVYKWLLPNKKWLNHDNPIVPNKEVRFDQKKWEEQQIDTQLEAAIQYLQAKLK